MLQYGMINHFNEVLKEVKRCMMERELPYRINILKENDIYRLELDLSAICCYDNDIMHFLNDLLNTCIYYEGSLNNNPCKRHIYDGYEILIYENNDLFDF